MYLWITLEAGPLAITGFQRFHLVLRIFFIQKDIYILLLRCPYTAHIWLLTKVVILSQPIIQPLSGDFRRLAAAYFRPLAGFFGLAGTGDNMAGWLSWAVVFMSALYKCSFTYVFSI